MRTLTKVEEQRLVDATLAATITEDGIKMKVGNTEYTFAKVRDDVSDEDFRNQCVDYIRKKAKQSICVLPPLTARQKGQSIQEALLVVKKYLHIEQEFKAFVKMCIEYSKLDETFTFNMDSETKQKHWKKCDEMKALCLEEGKKIGINKIYHKDIAKDYLYALNMVPRAWRNAVNNN